MSYASEISKRIALEKELLKSITSINNRIKNYFDKGGKNDTLKLECLVHIQSFYKEQLKTNKL